MNSQWAETAAMERQNGKGGMDMEGIRKDGN